MILLLEKALLYLSRSCNLFCFSAMASSKGFRLSQISLAALLAMSFQCSFRVFVLFRGHYVSLQVASHPKYPLYTISYPLYKFYFLLRVRDKEYSFRGQQVPLSPTRKRCLLYSPRTSCRCPL